jgi:molybdopterin molybdotransferase
LVSAVLVVGVGGVLRFAGVGEALGALLGEVSLSLGGEVVGLLDAVGRYSFRDYVSRVDLPPFDRSAVDGVAARFSDVAGASESSPVALRLVGSLDVDSSDTPTLGRSEAVLVSTGAPIPRGADVVVPIEYCVVRGDTVLVYRTYPRLANVSLRGEDLRVGDPIARRGTKLRPWHVAALAASGYREVEVFRKLRVAVVNTGDEVVRGVIPNTTYYIVSSLVREMGGEVVHAAAVPDDVDRISEAVGRALQVSDVVVVTGGTSVGSRDLTSEAVLRLEGAREVFHGLRVKPGRTTGAYVVGGKPVLAVSGLPVAAYVTLNLLLTTILSKLYGTPPEPGPSTTGILTRRLANEVGFRSYYRVVVCRDGDRNLVIPLKLTGSGLLSTLIKGNAILEIPEELEGLEEGSEVAVTLLGPIVDCSNLPQAQTV